MSLLKEYVRQTLLESQVPKRIPLELKIPNDLQRIHGMMKDANRQLYVVGGAVRDTLMNKVPKDYDLATDASPDQVMEILGMNKSLKLDLTGKMFGVVRAWTPEGNEYEIATFRKDIGKGRRPDGVEFTTIDQDVARRDLTINALFYDMDTGEAVDYVGGLEDIKSGTIRAVGEPSKRFDEDKLRILRALRFAARMDSGLDAETKQAIIDDNNLWSDPDMTAERVTEEFVKGIKSAVRPEYYIDLVEEMGLFSQILRELNVNPAQATSSNSVPIQLAFLLGGNEPKRLTKALNKMRYDRRTIDTVGFLVALSKIDRTSATKLKKEFKRIGSPVNIVEEFSSYGALPKNILKAFLQFASSPPAVNPQELMSRGLKGAEIGHAMADAEEKAYAAMIGEVRKHIRELLSDKAFKKATV